jgi:hypothetical protein
MLLGQALGDTRALGDRSDNRMLLGTGQITAATRPHPAARHLRRSVGTDLLVNTATPIFGSRRHLTCPQMLQGSRLLARNSTNHSVTAELLLNQLP